VRLAIDQLLKPRHVARCSLDDPHGAALPRTFCHVPRYRDPNVRRARPDFGGELYQAPPGSPPKAMNQILDE
jgi:hypothetical protein